MKQKVLFIYHTSSIGGGSYCLLNILKNLRREEIEPVVLLREEGPLVNAIKELDIDVHFMPSMRLVPYNQSTITIQKLVNAANLIASFKDFRQVLKDVSPDVVYVNTMMMYPYLRIAKQLGKKTAIHIREHWPKGEHSWQRNQALHHIAQYADHIVAINRYSASMMSPYHRTATIVYDWIDMNTRYEGVPLSGIFREDMTGKKVYMYMGGLQEIKGAYEVVNAFTNHIPDSDSRLLVLGINTNYKSRGLKGLVKKCLRMIGCETYSEKVIRMINADPRIKCIPGLYNIRHLYEQVYCIVSYFTIPHANLALAESIITHTMNVAARSDESLEYSVEGEMAMLYEENNFQDFVAKLKSLDSNRDTYIAKMKENSAVIATLFDPKRNIDQLNNVLKSI